MTDSTRAEFEAWWDSKREANDGIAIGADYRHWALAGWQAARKASLEEAAAKLDSLFYYSASAVVRALADGATKEGAGD